VIAEDEYKLLGRHRRFHPVVYESHHVQRRRYRQQHQHVRGARRRAVQRADQPHVHLDIHADHALRVGRDVQPRGGDLPGRVRGRLRAEDPP